MKNLPSLAFSRGITSVVIGDVLFYSVDKSEIEIKHSNQAHEFNKAGWDNSCYFVISYADRPNTGRQPVDGDVRVHINSEPESWRSNSQCITWSEIGINKSWKPNHDYMVKAYQESELKKEATMSHYNAERAHHIAIMTNELIDAPSKLDFVVKPDELKSLEVVALERLSNLNEGRLISHADMVDKLNKPIFTQAQSDAGELPLVGSEFMCSLGRIDDYTRSYAVGLDGSGQWLVIQDSYDNLFMHNIENGVYKFKPIQTDADKLRGHLWYSINGNVGVNDGIETIIDKLIESPEYTITLNKGG